MPLGGREFTISVSNGTLKLNNIDFQNADGKVEGTVTADPATPGVMPTLLTDIRRPALTDTLWYHC